MSRTDPTFAQAVEAAALIAQDMPGMAREEIDAFINGIASVLADMYFPDLVRDVAIEGIRHMILSELWP